MGSRAFAGLRITVDDVLSYLAAGMSEDCYAAIAAIRRSMPRRDSGGSRFDAATHSGGPRFDAATHSVGPLFDATPHP